MEGYFDYNATAPIDTVARAMRDQVAAEHWQNASSLYRSAGGARRVLEDARAQLAAQLDGDPERIVFVATATEANNGVFESVARRCAAKDRVVLSAFEHPSVREAAQKWFGQERMIEIPVGEGGGVALEKLESLLSNGGVALVSVMAVNNETGVLLPWEAVADCCARYAVPYHCDAVQHIGKLPCAAMVNRCDYLTACGHKLGGGIGAGFIVAPEGKEVCGSVGGSVGGPQEGGRRAGTENVPAIAAMVAALAAKSDVYLRENEKSWLSIRNGFEECVRERIPEIEILCTEVPRIWNTSMLVLPEVSNLKWLTRLDRAGFQVSTGSACSAGKGNPSHVMEALGLPYDAMRRVVRVSGGWHTTEADWLALAEAIAGVREELRSGSRQKPTLDLGGLGM